MASVTGVRVMLRQPVDVVLASAYHVPADVGVKLTVPDASGVPPDASAYQSAVTPVPVTTVNAGIGWFEQIFRFPPLTGAGGTVLMVKNIAVREVLTHPEVAFRASAFQVPPVGGA